MTGDGERSRLARIRGNLELRARILQFTRAFFTGQGFLEVETPVRVPAVAPEANIAPFESEGWFLLTSPELHMKRLMAAGYDRIFQVSRCFRKGERGQWHNPEFCLLEWYRAGAGYLEMVQDTEQLVAALAAGLGRDTSIEYQGRTINIETPWPRLAVREAFMLSAGWDPVARPDPSRFDEDLVMKVVPRFSATRPSVLLDYPADMASLARLKPGQPEVAERAEVFMGGLELANAYSELTDRAEQERRFREEMAAIQRLRGGPPGADAGEKIALQRFLEAVGHLPPCGGIALGMDRLAMLFAGAASIEDVMPFTADTA
ncbi:MAG: EF-P lysine aminoacylase GenX [Chloroflexi bacterium]|nr:EF-P lysine aminoacylase GenX [Chloroflexota bacterium]